MMIDIREIRAALDTASDDDLAYAAERVADALCYSSNAPAEDALIVVANLMALDLRS